MASSGLSPAHRLAGAGLLNKQKLIQARAPLRAYADN
jgi:hypothetical protein